MFRYWFTWKRFPNFVLADHFVANMEEINLFLIFFDTFDGQLFFNVNRFLLTATVENLTDSHNILIRQGFNKLTTIVVENDVDLFVD